MNFHIISLFPEVFVSYLSESILKRAIDNKKIKVHFYNPRDYAPLKKPKKIFTATGLPMRERVDDIPYGGGPGMVIQALPVLKAIEKAIKKTKKQSDTKIIWLSPSGKQFDTAMAQHLAGESNTKKIAQQKNIIIVCGRYEGIDARVKKAYKVMDVSIGPFVVTGGELPAMMLIDCVARQIPGVLGSFDSLEERRISSPNVYTRPEIIVYKGKKLKVPTVLLSGNHKKIDEWKKGTKSQ